MSTAKVLLWFVRETPLARLYFKLPASRAQTEDGVWIPRSIIEHTSKLNSADLNEHILTLPEWFVEKYNL